MPTAAEHPCTSCHGDAHSIFPKTDPRSAVYPLNIPRTCGSCHGNDAMAKKHGLPNVYPLYIDSIHGFALSKEGLLVAANCQSCHGSHHILSHKDPLSPTYKANIPKTCGTCHAGITADYEDGVHGKAVAAGNLDAPVCSDCHTAHAIEQPTAAAFRMQSTPICGSATRTSSPLTAIPSTRSWARWAAMWRRRAAGTATERMSSARVRSALADQQGQPGEDLRQVPCGRQRQLCPVPAACQRAQSQAESGALLHPPVHESAAGRRAYVLRDSHHPVADPLALRPDQEKIRRRRKKCLIWSKRQTEARSKAARRSRYFMRFTRAQRYLHAVLFTTFLGLAATGLPHAFQREHLGAPVRQRGGRIRGDYLLPQALRRGSDPGIPDPRERHHYPRASFIARRESSGERPRWWPTGRM